MDWRIFAVIGYNCFSVGSIINTIYLCSSLKKADVELASDIERRGDEMLQSTEK
jgi:hypothetical protein